MKAEDVPAELVEKAARAIHASQCCPLDKDSQCYGWPINLEEETARHALAAVLPEVRAQAHRAGYEMARADMVSGGFIGGPTYEALRDSFTGRQIAQEALRDAAHAIRITDGYGSDWLRERAARLAATTERPTT